MLMSARPARSIPGLRYLEQRPPLVFPSEERVPESRLHFHLRTLLYQLLEDAFGAQITVGSDQFMYYDASDPSQSLAPDVYVRLGPSPEPITSWKVWERGAPELAVEIISDGDASDRAWQSKLECYWRLGVSELVRFDPNDASRPLRLWDRVQEVLVEREVTASAAPSLVLDLEWRVAPLEGAQCALRIAREGVLIPSRIEGREAERQARLAERQARLAERQARLAEERARQRAEEQARVATARAAELEAELERLRRER